MFVILSEAKNLRLSDFGSALTGQSEMFRFTQHDRRLRDARLPHRFATANLFCGGLGSLCYSSRAALTI